MLRTPSYRRARNTVSPALNIKPPNRSNSCTRLAVTAGAAFVPSAG
jgi:hypothetical protein